jgi:DNA-binding MarR family transcriptional regulator
MTKTARDDLLSRCACFDLRKATRAVSRLYDDCLRPLGLNITQYSLLRVIESTPQISVSTLSRYMVMDRTSVTRALTPLERDGFVKTRAGSDKRTRIVSLTNKGIRLLANASPLWHEAQNTFLYLVGNQRWSALHELLKDTTGLMRHRDEAAKDNIDIERHG